MPDLDRASTIAVLDVNHGGLELAEAFAGAGFDAFAVDVYRTRKTRSGKVPVVAADAAGSFDALVVPVHLPESALARRAEEHGCPVVTHHEAAGYLAERLGLAGTMKPIEITGTVGKTTAAFALAEIAAAAGERVLLHTSNGLYFEGRRTGTGLSIAPSSVLAALGEGRSLGATVAILEVSLGVCGVGRMAALTSLEGDYPIAGGTRMASGAKLASIARLGSDRQVVCPGGVSVPMAGSPCTFGPGGAIDYGAGGAITHKGAAIASGLPRIVEMREYRSPVLCAAAAALAAGITPDAIGRGLRGFRGVEGRMRTVAIEGRTLLDNSNSGLTAEGVAHAIQYAAGGPGRRVIVLGEESKNVCSGLDPEGVVRIAEAGGLDGIVLVGGRMRELAARHQWAEGLAGGMKAALALTSPGDIIISCVKTWR